MHSICIDHPFTRRGNGGRQKRIEGERKDGPRLWLATRSIDAIRLCNRASGIVLIWEGFLQVDEDINIKCMQVLSHYLSCVSDLFPSILL